MESPIHRAMSIDYGVVIEGKFRLSLDSGESKIMLPGDMSKCRITSSWDRMGSNHLFGK